MLYSPLQSPLADVLEAVVGRLRARAGGAVPAVDNAILLESGDILLLESGDYLLLEA